MLMFNYEKFNFVSWRDINIRYIKYKKFCEIIVLFALFHENFENFENFFEIVNFMRNLED